MKQLDAFAAVLFDLDGVLTSTAAQHFSAWKQMFDDFLRRRADERGEAFVPFTQEDYNEHVDGLPRYDGVRNFLAARTIRLPEGGPEDPPYRDTVHGLGNRKNDLVNELIRTQGVTAYEGSVALVHALRESGVRTAVVTSSRNGATILQAAGIDELFEARVDGNVAAELGLAGKPAPDTFLEAARRLQVEPGQAAVVEDALSGVQAGRTGGFGLVVGVDRVGQADALYHHGADVVVTDLGALLD